MTAETGNKITPVMLRKSKTKSNLDLKQYFWPSWPHLCALVTMDAHFILVMPCCRASGIYRHREEGCFWNLSLGWGCGLPRRSSEALDHFE